MPYINLKTTTKVTEEKAEILKAKFGKAIESFPGKTESWLMVGIEDNPDYLKIKDNLALFSSNEKERLFPASTTKLFNVVESINGLIPIDSTLLPIKIVFNDSQYFFTISKQNKK